MIRLVVKMVASALMAHHAVPLAVMAVEHDSNRLVVVAAGRHVHVTGDGGASWRRTGEGVHAGFVQTWTHAARPCGLLAGTAPRHVCTQDDGSSWQPAMTWLRAPDAVFDVHAAPADPKRLVGVWHIDGIGARPVESTDGGTTWSSTALPLQGSLSIAGVLDDGRVVARTGKARGAFSGVLRMGADLRSQEEVAGPWRDTGSIVAQCTVDEMASRRWVVSTWQADTGAEATWYTHDAGGSFEPLEVPQGIVWPLVFVGRDGTLAGRLPPGHLALKRPESPWRRVPLPPAGDALQAVAGRLFATEATDEHLYELVDFDVAEPMWRLLLNLAMPASTVD